MAKVLHLDCVGGLSGDMFLCSMIDLGIDAERWERKLRLIPIEGLSLRFEKSRERGFGALRLVAEMPKPPKDLRHPAAIAELIEDSKLSDGIRDCSLKMLDSLVEAEAAAHGVRTEEVHFHELAGFDLILDLVGASIAIDLLAPDRITCSPLPMGRGSIQSEHGVIPLPAPATLNLLHGLPVIESPIEGETVTPTGAALARGLVDRFCGFGGGRILATGIGAGTRKGDVLPNILRAVLLADDREGLSESLIQIETNIDDMNPEHYDLLIERLFADGALDVWLTNILMKKGRPAHSLSVLLRPEQKQRVMARIYAETSTIGLRIRELRRESLNRREEFRDTPLGKVRGKLIEHPSGLRWLPEYDEVKRLSIEHNLPIREVQIRLERLS